MKKTYTYDESINKANHYIVDFDDFKDYIVTSNMPYNYENGHLQYSIECSEVVE